MTAGTQGWRFADGMTPPGARRVDDATTDTRDTSTVPDAPRPTEET